MAKRIYKYAVPGKMTGRVKRWLQPNYQYGELMIWAELDDNVEEEEWTVVPVGTGWEIEGSDATILDEGVYCGTVLEDDGTFIWHIYAVKTSVIRNQKSDLG